MIVNAYVLYKSVLFRKGRKPLNNYEIRHQVVLEKLNPKNYDSRETVVEKIVMERKAQQISKRSEKEASARTKSAPVKIN